MEELEKLQKIGAEEISKNTHIAHNKILNILNKNFGELRDKATTTGLIHILEREYKVNLAEWIGEYEEFLKEAPQDNEQRVAVDFKVIHENTKTGDSKKSITFVIIVILLAVGGYYAYNNFNQINEQIKVADDTQTKSDENPQIHEENKEAQKEIEQETKQENTEKQENSADQISQDTTQVNAQESTQTTKQEVISESLQTQQAKQEQLQEIQEATQKKVVLNPQTDTWLGIIYLDTRQKVSLMIKDSFEIDTKREQTIMTGNGLVEIMENGAIMPLAAQKKFYFYVDKEGKIHSLSRRQYNRQNGGLRW